MSRLRLHGLLRIESNLAPKAVYLSAFRDPKFIGATTWRTCQNGRGWERRGVGKSQFRRQCLRSLPMKVLGSSNESRLKFILKRAYPIRSGCRRPSRRREVTPILRSGHLEVAKANANQPVKLRRPQIHSFPQRHRWPICLAAPRRRRIANSATDVAFPVVSDGA
jgi:hypothetical protein